MDYSSSYDPTDERTSLVSSFVRTSKSRRKYGSTSNNMNDSSSPQTGAYTHHKVQPCDTLQGIALRYQTSVSNENGFAIGSTFNYAHF